MHRRAPLLCALAAACGSDPAAPDAAPADAPGRCSLPSLSLKVATLGGCPSAGTEDGPRGHARFDNPSNVAIGPGGITYVTDAGSGRLRAVDASGEAITLVQRPEFQRPHGIAVAPGGVIYIGTDADDTGTISPTSGTIWRLVGAGAPQVIARGIGRPRGLAVLPDGRLALADPLHHTLSILDPATGTVTPLAGAFDQPGYQNGTGDAARFAAPTDLVLLADGDLAVSDQGNHRIRRVTLTGVASDLAGSGAAGNLDGPTDVATFDAPHALAVVPAVGLFVTDTRRNFIRKIAAGAVTTVVGDGGRGWLDSDTPRSAKLAGLEGLDTDGVRLLVADGNRGDGAPYHHVRVIDLSSL